MLCRRCRVQMRPLRHRAHGKIKFRCPQCGGQRAQERTRADPHLPGGQGLGEMACLGNGVYQRANCLCGGSQGEREPSVEVGRLFEALQRVLEGAHEIRAA